MNDYTAITVKDGDWWIGWVAEVPGALGQERTQEKLLESLQEAVEDLQELALDAARRKAAEDFGDAVEEHRISAKMRQHEETRPAKALA